MDSKKEVKKTSPIVIVGIILLVIICLPVLFGTDTPTKEETKKVEKKKENYAYSWKCTKDRTTEHEIETQIIGVGSKENADYSIEPGTYKIIYNFKEYSSITSSKKYNRQYIITVVDKYIDVKDLETYENQKFYMYTPDSYDTKELTFTEGQYVYVQHLATPGAGDGDIFFKKK